MHKRITAPALLLHSLAAPVEASEPSTPGAEQDALTRFYESTDGASWGSTPSGSINEGWLVGSACSGDTPNWMNVVCDSSGSVTEL